MSTCALPGEHCDRCREENFDVGPERARSGVMKVETHHLVEGRAAAARDLPETGDSRLGLQNLATMPRLVLLDFVLERRPRADKRHVASQHVPELWQLVKAGLPKNPPDWRDP